jgi:intracellular multiplication protein IcmD
VKKIRVKNILVPHFWITGIFAMFFLNDAFAAQSLGTLASSITGSFGNLAKLITAMSYMAGLAFAVGAIMKFKQHKDNPTQIPIGTPIALLFIAAALLFLPTVLGIAGKSIFGDDAKSGGPGGTIPFETGGLD